MFARLVALVVAAVFGAGSGRAVALEASPPVAPKPNQSRNSSRRCKEKEKTAVWISRSAKKRQRSTGCLDLSRVTVLVLCWRCCGDSQGRAPVQAGTWWGGFSTSPRRVCPIRSNRTAPELGYGDILDLALDGKGLKV